MYRHCAFCTLVMLDRQYALGAIVLAKSLLESKTECRNFICMVTPDIDEETRRALSEYWQVIEVDYLTLKTHPLRTKRIDFLYGKWIDYACTKWQFLRLLDEKTDYKQIMYIDADSCVMRNVDHLFFSPQDEVKTPAYQAKICLFSCFQTINPRILKNALSYRINEKEKHYYQYGLTNLQIPIKWLSAVWEKAILGKVTNQVLMASAVMVWKKSRYTKPATLLSDLIEKNVKDQNNVIFSQRRSLFYNGWDEQILMQSILDIAGDVDIAHLPLCYCWTAGFYHALPMNVQPFVMTFWGKKKPWYFDENVPVQYMDVYIWRYFAERAGINYRVLKPTVT